jgi:hypothetical protein
MGVVSGERSPAAVAVPEPVNPDLDLDLIDFLLTLTPAERLARHEGALELVRALRKAGITHHGFDPRAVASAGDV